jgi:hypothetical protein
MRKMCFVTSLGISCSLLASAPARAEGGLVPVSDGAEVAPPRLTGEWAQFVGMVAKSSAISAESEVNKTAVDQAQKITCPADKNGLDDGFDQFTYSLNKSAAVKLNFYANADMTANDKVVLQQLVWYKDIQNASGETIARCASGILVAVKVKDAGANFSTSLPLLAVNGEAKLQQVDYRLRTFGMSGTGIDTAIPPALKLGKFDTEAYISILQAVDKIRDAVIKEPATVTFRPKIAAITADDEPDDLLSATAVRAMAIGQISKGKKCAFAQGAVVNRNSVTDDAVREVYVNIMGSNACSGDVIPTDADRNRAGTALTTYSLKF